MKFLFVGQQNIVNYWDFPSEISRNCHKRLVTKNARQDWGEIFVKTSLRDCLVCFAEFVEMTLIAVFFLLPNNLLRVCFPTDLAAAGLKIFLSPTTSEFSGAAISNISSPTCFAAGTIYLRKFGIAFLRKT